MTWVFPVSIFCSSFLSLFQSWGKPSPKFLIPNSKFPIQLEILSSKFLILNLRTFFLQLEKYFSPTGKVIFCALSNHTTKVRQAYVAIIRFSTLQYDSIRFHMLYSSPGFLAVRSDEALWALPCHQITHHAAYFLPILVWTHEFGFTCVRFQEREKY